MKVEINIKDIGDKIVHSATFTITKLQYEIFKHYIRTLMAKFKKEE